MPSSPCWRAWSAGRCLSPPPAIRRGLRNPNLATEDTEFTEKARNRFGHLCILQGLCATCRGKRSAARRNGAEPADCVQEPLHAAPQLRQQPPQGEDEERQRDEQDDGVVEREPDDGER